MNFQGKNGIEWCDATYNPIGGCKHGCRWHMPDGTTAICYAETVAEGVARTAYPQGFGHHYWHPNRLNEPLSVKTPARIFLDSMSDIMGHWVPDEQIQAVLDVCRAAHWHTFQLLTKNAPRLLKFEFPPNMWVGVSSPPDVMMGKPLTDGQKQSYMDRALDVLTELKQRGVAVPWMSIEPLSWAGMPAVIADHPGALAWAVVGAASNGRAYHQPSPAVFKALMEVLNKQKVAVFFKGNLTADNWREEFPAVQAAGQLELF